MSYVDSTLAQRRPGQPQTRELIEQLLSKATSAIERDVPEARALLAEAVSLLRAHRGRVVEQEATDGVQRGGLAAWQARSAARHIDLHLERTIPVTELAALVRLSRTHFSAAFHVTFGRPPHTYVLERRVEQAKRLMLETDLPLSQIACACGLCDQAHLSRLFRRFVGQSPLLWRRAHLEPGERATRLLAGHAMRLDA